MVLLCLKLCFVRDLTCLFFPQCDMNAAHMQLLTHTIYCLKSFLQDIEPQTPSFFLSFFSLATERRPHPADSAFKVHGEITGMPSLLHTIRGLSVLTNINYQTWVYYFNIECFFSSKFRMQTLPACWVQVLLGTWRTWAWPSPTSPVPVPSSSSSCLHSNSSTSGPHRYTDSTDTTTNTH